MYSHRDRSRRLAAFTLIELLVVVGVIGMLVAVMAFGITTIRKSARKVESQSRVEALSAGLEVLSNDTGQGYPPSALPEDVQEVFPLRKLPHEGSSDGSNRPQINGATFLVWALAGKDLLGTAGFQDLDRDGTWFDEMHSKAGGLYELDDQGNPRHFRKGLYVDTRILGTVDISQLQPDHPGNMFALDGFGYPILYYKANPPANYKINPQTGDPSTINQVAGSNVKQNIPILKCDRNSIYRQADNWTLTGGINDDWFAAGIDLGAGRVHNLNPSALQEFVFKDPGMGAFRVKPKLKPIGLFQDFIQNRRVTVRYEPANRNSFLLISPGPDALWGTEDDIANFDHHGTKLRPFDIPSPPTGELMPADNEDDGDNSVLR